MRCRDGRRRRRARRSAGCAAVGSKKWKRAGSTASVTVSPDAHGVRGIDPRGEERRLAGEQARRLSASRAYSAATGGASTGKKTCASAPSSSTTSTLASIRRQVAPRRTTPPRRPPAGCRARRARPGRAGGRAGSSGTRYWPNATWSPSIVASTRFIAGEPMNAATNRLTRLAVERLRRRRPGRPARRASRRHAGRASSPRSDRA